MFTLFHALLLAGFLFGAFSGARVGSMLFGTVGAVCGAMVGALVGVVAGRIPWLLAMRSLARDLGRKTTTQLRASLHSSGCLTPNAVLLELQRRGEDIRCELPIVLDLLVSDDIVLRSRGWAALTSAFPQLAERVRDYRIGDSLDECRRKTELLGNRPNQAG
jgi:hypothetical protein